MPEDPIQGADHSALQTQINQLGSRMESNFAEIKSMLRTFDDRLRQDEKEIAGFVPVTKNSLDAAWRKIDQHEEDLENMTKAVDALVLTASKQETIIKWGAGILAALITTGAIYLLSRLITLAVTHQ